MDELYMINWRDPIGGEAYRVKVWRKNEIEAAEWFNKRYPFVQRYEVVACKKEDVFFKKKNKKRCRVAMIALATWATLASIAAVLLLFL